MLDVNTDIKAAIEKVVRERFSSVNIVRVDVEEGEDYDGDSVFFVSVVFDAEVEDLDASRLSGLTRHIRSKLSNLGERRFPYTNFISKNDFEGAAA